MSDAASALTALEANFGGKPLALGAVAELLSFSEKTVRREIQRGKLRSAKLGGRRFVYPKDLVDYMKKGRGI